MNADTTPGFTGPPSHLKGTAVASTVGIAIRDVVDRNPISWFQYRTLCLCFLCIVVDGLEVTVVGFLPAALKDDWGIGTAQLAPAMTAGLIGLGIGALAGGPLGDRLGRKKIIVWAIGAFMVTTLLTATSDGVLPFSGLRLLTGIGLGASMPNVAALVSEIVPTDRRRSIVAVVWSGFPPALQSAPSRCPSSSTRSAGESPFSYAGSSPAQCSSASGSSCLNHRCSLPTREVTIHDS